jgi:flagellar basal-body rod modification protein FlgD
MNSPLAGGVSAPADGNSIRDQKDPSTDPKFGEVLRQVQEKYGAKPERPKEIKKTLGKDDFMRIMITQMKHQDPTAPFKPDQMAAQMAQFASVEQLQNVNQSIEKLSTKNSPLEKMAMTGLIGKTVTVDRGRFSHAMNNNETLSYSLPKNASQTKITIFTDSGEPIFEKDLGANKAGEGSFTWDGYKENNLPSKPGNYIYRLTAVDENGGNIELNPQKTARVIGVSFEGTEPSMIIGDAQSHSKVLVKDVIRVETEAGPATEGKSIIQSTPKKQNLFTFQKGVGSENMDPSQLSPEMQEAVAKATAMADAVTKPAKTEAMAEAKAEARAVAQSPQIEPGSGNLNAGFVNIEKGGEKNE